MDTMTFQQIVRHYGSVELARRALNLGSRQTIYNWRTSGVPLAQQVRLHRLTRGKLRLPLKNG